MISLTNLPDASLDDATKIEEIRLLIVHAIDDLEQLARSRELTNLIWDVNSTNREQNWSKTSALLESYENSRDKSLKSALSTLRELSDMIEKETLITSSSENIDENTNVELTLPFSADIDEDINLELTVPSSADIDEDTNIEMTVMKSL